MAIFNSYVKLPEGMFHHIIYFLISSPFSPTGCRCRGNEVAAPLLEKYLKGKQGVTVENRRRILRLIENMTMGRPGDGDADGEHWWNVWGNDRLMMKNDEKWWLMMKNDG